MSEIETIPHNFKLFIQGLLKKGRVKKNNIKLFTNETNLLIFREAFTHKTYNDEYNYELYEFLGDTTVNDITARYIHDRFPRIVSVKWLTRIKHNLISTKILGKFAEKDGWLPHILYGDEIAEIIAGKDKEYSDDYNGMLEDVFEGFTGALVSVIDKEKRRGVGYAVAYNIVESYLDTLEISLQFEDQWDSKSRLKEIFDQYKWELDKNIHSVRLDLVGSGKNKTIDPTITERLRGNVWETTIYGFPKGNKMISDENKMVIAKVTDKTKKLSQQSASEKGIKKLEKFNIISIPPDPYQKN